MPNAHSWRGYFERMFQPYLDRPQQALGKRLVLTFDRLAAEATGRGRFVG